MFIPLHDKNALEHISRPYVTTTLIIINIIVWVLTNAAMPEATANAIAAGLGFIPDVVFGDAVLDPSLVLVPADLTVVTYSFLHADFMHLASNMLFLWVFGDNVEDALGHFKYLIFYFTCAAVGALFHGLVAVDGQGPLIGASGAIAGVVAAYLMLHPKVRLWILVLFRFPVPLPAAIPLLFWVGQQFYMLAVDRESNVSWGAHTGGIIAGIILVVYLRRPGVELFDREPAAVTEPVHTQAVTAHPEPPRETEKKKTSIRWGR